MPTRLLTFCLCPSLPLFVLASAIEVLRHANRLGGREFYRWVFLTDHDEEVSGSNGMLLQPTARVADAANADMAFVVAGFEAWDLRAPRLAGWVSDQAARGAVVGGVSNGGFVLAGWGLLDGYAATVHWEDFSSFYERYPSVQSRYQRFVIDRNRMTCSGGVATLDMFLEIVRRDLGEQITRKVARQMQLSEFTGGYSAGYSAVHGVGVEGAGYGAAAAHNAVVGNPHSDGMYQHDTAADDTPADIVDSSQRTEDCPRTTHSCVDQVSDAEGGNNKTGCANTDLVESDESALHQSEARTSELVPLPLAGVRSQQYSPLVQRILGLLDADIAGSMTVNSLANKVGLSRRELLRLLRRETGQTPSDILNSRRLERARSLVLHSHLPLAAIANAVGFSSQSHLTMRYRQMYGVTPARHRRA
jgi:transcriptional regulator GlxA family with amidase domain